MAPCEMKLRPLQPMWHHSEQSDTALNRACQRAQRRQCLYACLFTIIEQLCRLFKFGSCQDLIAQVGFEENAEVKIDIGYMVQMQSCGLDNGSVGMYKGVFVVERGE